jgi:hypothetical protein
MKVTKARDVVFIEDSACKNRNLKEDVEQNAEVELQPLLSEDIHEETSSEATQMVAEEKAEHQEQVKDGQPTEPRYEQRVRQPKDYHDGIITYHVTCDQKENLWL